MKEEVAAVMAQAETTGVGRACSVAKRRSTSALAVLQLLSVLLWSCSTSQLAWVRIRCGLLVKACQRTCRRPGVRQPAMHKEYKRTCTLPVVYRACVNLARLPRHFAHSDVWVLDEQQPDLHPALRRQLRGNRSARRCAHV